MKYDSKTNDLIQLVRKLVRDCAYDRGIPERLQLTEGYSIREHIAELHAIQSEYECYSEESEIVEKEMNRLRDIRRCLLQVESCYKDWVAVAESGAADKIVKENILRVLNGLGKILDNLAYGMPLTLGLTPSQKELVEDQTDPTLVPAAESEPLSKDTPREYVTRLRQSGMNKNTELATKLDECFPGLSHPVLGDLLAIEGDIRSAAANKQRGRRARGHRS